MLHSYLIEIEKVCENAFLHEQTNIKITLNKTIGDVQEYLYLKKYHEYLDSYDWITNNEKTKFLNAIQHDWDNNLIDTNKLYNEKEMKDFILHKYYYDILTKYDIISSFESEIKQKCDLNTNITGKQIKYRISCEDLNYCNVVSII